MGTLYLVSTPIGNLGDISPRAEETLRSVDRILTEDTRRSRLLAQKAGSKAPLVSLHAHNERERSKRILSWLSNGEDLALLSDAGTPLVSDPGGRTVAGAIESGHRVVPIPGPSAVLSALIASGLPSERFAFLGFPERKGNKRKAFFERVALSNETVVLFESPRRLLVLLDELAEKCGHDRQGAVARELTKVHEEIMRGTLTELAAHYRESVPKGEVTLVIAPNEQILDEAAQAVEARALCNDLLDRGMKPSEVAKEVAESLALARNEAYRIVHELQRSRNSG